MSESVDQREPRADGDGGHVSILRPLAIGLPLLVAAGLLVQILEVYRSVGSVSGDVIPALALALFLPILLLAAALPVLRRRWAVTRGELVIVFSMLVLAVPLYGTGFWRHFAPLQFEYHRTRDLDRAMSISRRLWPTDGDLLAGLSVERRPDAATTGATWHIADPRTTTLIPAGAPEGPCVRMLNPSTGGASEIRLTLDRTVAARFPEPGRRYALYARMRLDADPAGNPSAGLLAGSGPDAMVEVAALHTATRPGLLARDRYRITGKIDVMMPHDLGERFHVMVRFAGQGTLWIRDVSLVDTEQVYRYLEGYAEADPAVYDQLDEARQGVVRRRPSDPVGLARHVMTGLAPWDRWAQPLWWWGLLTAALFLAMACLVSLFYRQWASVDRMTFPLQTFILDLTRADEGGRLAWLRSRPFWIGLIVCLVHLSLQQGSRFAPDLPYVSLRLSIPELLPPGPLRDATAGAPYQPPLELSVRPLYVAIAFFMSLEISLSLVAFYLVGWAYQIIGYFTPLKTLSAAGPFEGPRYPNKDMLAMGGLLFMALFCVLSARKHLVGVARRVVGRGDGADPGTTRGYRLASLGLLVAVAMMIVFARGAGVSTAFVLVFLGIHLLLAVSAARIRAETGMPSAGIILAFPQHVMVCLGGVLVFGYREVSFTSQAGFFTMGAFLMTAPILAESMAVAERLGVPLRRMGAALAIAFATAILVGGLVSLSWAYTVGALNMNLAGAEKRHAYNRMTRLVEGDEQQIDAYFREHPDEPPVVTDEVVDRIGGIQPLALALVCASFGVTALLALARAIWLGFPLHPLGFALAFTPAMQALWGSIAVAWLMKHLGLRFGGVQLVRRVLRPFCVGLFAGELLAMILWRLIELLVQEVPPV